MDYDKDKVDEYTLALLLLVSHNREEGFGARAWKGFDWETMDRLHEKGFITNPVGKARRTMAFPRKFRGWRYSCSRAR